MEPSPLGGLEHVQKYSGGQCTMVHVHVLPGRV